MWRALIREVELNVRAFAIRSMVVAVAASFCGFISIAATVLEVDSIESAFQAQERAGLDTISVTSGVAGGLSASKCDAAMSIQGVTSAGGVLSTINIIPSQEPSARIPLVTVTPGYLSVDFPREPRISLYSSYASNGLADETGLVAGARLRFDSTSGHTRMVSQSIRVQGIGSTTARTSGDNRSMFIVSAPTGNVAECLVQASPNSGKAVTRALLGWFSDRQIRAVTVLDAGQLEVNPTAELHNRWSSLVWLIASTFVIALTSILWWTRRRDSALYRLLGFNGTHLAFMIALETVVTTLAPAQVGAAIALTIFRPSGGITTLDAVIHDDLRMAIFLLFAPLIGIGISRTGSAVDALKGL